MKNSLFISIVSFSFIYMLSAQNISLDPGTDLYTANFKTSVLDFTKPDCKDLIAVDETIDGKVQVLKTKSLTIVKRGNYSYTIEFINDKRGIVAKVNSYDGVQFNMGDQIIFMDESNNRIPYPFIEIGETAKEGEKSVHSNILKLDRTAIDWFSTSSTITTIYIKDNVANEMRKFTINEERRAGFKQLAICFDLNLAKAE